MNKDRETRILEQIAEAVADERSIDWDEQATAAPERAAALKRLRQIQKITAAYRRADSGEEGEASADSESPAATDRVNGASPLFTWGQLRVLEKLGEGSSGEVYRAFDPQLRREVALKLRRADDGTAKAEWGTDAESYLNEARHLARVRHPNVLTVYGADLHEGRIGIWTDLLRGKNLEERKSEEGLLGAREAALIGLDLCRALAAVHGTGLVHGDVKAANVMREDGGTIVLLDFGSGRGAPSEELPPGSDRLTGTPLSLAPEVLRGEAPTPAADIYALGVLLYRLVGGAYPIPAKTVEELLAKHVKRGIMPLRDLRADLPAAFIQVVERALSHDPLERFASAGEMERALAASIAPETTSATQTARGAGVRRRFLLPVLVSAAVLVVATLFGLRGLLQGEKGGLRGPLLDVQATLYKAGAGWREPLQSQGEVQVGDQLFLEIEAVEPTYVYILDEDAAGNLFVLFPVPGVDLSNPLPAGARHRLPGRLGGVSQDWKVTSAGGHETVLLVCSLLPVPALEEDLAVIPVVETDHEPVYAQLDPAALEGLRGIGGMAPSHPQNEAPAGGRLAELARRLAANPESRGSLWTQAFTLRCSDSQ
ncbi:serine/threonine-protein kinase [Candidatus Eisenbacteria bacterium]|uniref:Serine/threonine-protein kinase n=1 Tax=Eiseniibacteriota bacterium TaxID=2212470 RepID=A0ABV6YIS6_UNCEI